MKKSGERKERYYVKRCSEILCNFALYTPLLRMRLFVTCTLNSMNNRNKQNTSVRQRPNWKRRRE